MQLVLLEILANILNTLDKSSPVNQVHTKIACPIQSFLYGVWPWQIFRR